MKIRVSFTYEPKPEHYSHVPEPRTAAAIAVADQEAYDEQAFGLEEIMPDDAKVTFEVVEE